MAIKLSDHFKYGNLLRFTLPSVVMMIFTSIYGVVDGFFVSNFVGKTPFAAVNFIMPFLMMLGAFGFMFGAGGSALIAKILGEGDHRGANRIFSMLIYAAGGLGILIAVPGIAFLKPIAAWLGAEGELLTHCITYGRILLLALPALMLQFTFQSLFITAEKPYLGLASTVLAGVLNMVLDALFMAVFQWGVVGAAAATAISQLSGALFPLIYFSLPNSSLLRLGRPAFIGRALLKTCTNGSSELMSNVSMSLVNMLYNFQLMRYAGENGVAAYGVMMYICFVFIAAFIGFSTGSAPLVSYHYGAKNRAELKGLLTRSLVIIGVASVAMLVLGILLATPLSHLYVGYDEALLDMTRHGFVIFSLSFLFSGIAIYGSTFFTALNDGLTSALISFLRTLLFQVAAVLILPIFFELDGIWYSIVVAELIAAAVTAVFLFVKRKKYGY